MNENHIQLIKRRKESNSDVLMNILAFAFPFFVVVIAFAISGIYPIGKKVMLTVDCYHQYVPFLIEFRDKVLSGGSLFFTWNDGMGMEYYAAFANYSASPLNIFALFFTAKTMPIFVALITAVRAGLASLFMNFFLCGEDSGRRDYITVAFAASYALCGWFCTDFWNIMWCDALVLIPLIMLGLRLLFTEGRYFLYILSLGLLLISNYYVGFFACIFLLVFAPAYYFTCFQGKNEEIVEGKLGIKTFGICAGRFVAASLLAGLLSAFITIPTYLILQTTSATGSEFPKEFALTNDLFDFIARFLSAANPNIRGGMANVFCGIIPAALIPLFFAADKKTGISLRHKIVYGYILVLMYLSFSNRILDFIWHGFHFPNQIPYRQSFLMCFLVVVVAYKTIRNLKSFSLGQISAVFIGAGVYLILFEKFGDGEEGYVQILISLLFIIVDGVILTSIKKGRRRNPQFYESLVAGAMAVEILASSCVVICTVGAHEGFPSYSTYGKNRNIIHEYAESVEGTEGHNSFERTELYPNNICDIQSVYGVKGVSVFSSTARESFVKYMRNFGFHNNGINSIRNAGLTSVTNTIFGVRNMACYENTSSRPLMYEEEYVEDSVTVYGNPDALEVGFMVDESILDYAPNYDNYDVFEKTNMWINSMGIEGDIYEKINFTIIDSTNVTETRDSLGYHALNVDSNDKTATFTILIDDATIGSEILIYPHSSKGGTLDISYRTVDGQISKENSVTGITLRAWQIVSLGVYDGTPIEATFRYSTPPSGALNIYGYEVNQDVYNNMVSILSSEQVTVTDYNDTSLSCNINVSKSGLLMFTVAYNDGFNVTVDGEPAEITSIQDALIGIKLEDGYHEIVLTYKPVGFKLGLALSLTALVAFLIVSYLSYRIYKKKLLPVAVASGEAAEPIYAAYDIAPQNQISTDSATEVPDFNSAEANDSGLDFECENSDESEEEIIEVINPDAAASDSASGDETQSE